MENKIRIDIDTLFQAAEPTAQSLLASMTFGDMQPLMPGSDGRQESLSRRDFHSFFPLVAAT